MLIAVSLPFLFFGLNVKFDGLFFSDVIFGDRFGCKMFSEMRIEGGFCVCYITVLQLFLLFFPPRVLLISGKMNSLLIFFLFVGSVNCDYDASLLITLLFDWALKGNDANLFYCFLPDSLYFSITLSV
jgi:hypothetical protein